MLTTNTSAMSSPSFAEFDRRAWDGESLRVAFFGGSLTWGAQATDPQKTSYRALIGRCLESKYPRAHFTYIDAAIGGTGSQLAAFRLHRDVLAYEPDLVFLDFTVNDDATKEPKDDRLSSYESLVRRIVSAHIPVVQVILAVKADVMPKPRPRPLDDLHKAVGAAYNLPLADAVALMRAKVQADKATPDELWDLPNDATHPGDAGYALYAEAVWNTFLEAVEKGTVCTVPETMLHPSHYMIADRFDLATMKQLPAGWSRGVPHRSAVAFDFVCSRWMDDLAIAEATDKTKPEPLTLKFTGRTVLLFGESTQKSGRYAVRLNGGEAVEFTAHCKAGNMRYSEIVAKDLEPDTEHTLEIIPLLEAGEEFRLNSICVAGGKVRGDSQTSDRANASDALSPDMPDVSYGAHERNVMDVWLARSDRPTPCVLFIHGGGWLNGDKSKGAKPAPYLKEGISYIAINYRYLEQTIVDTGSERGRGPIQPRGKYQEPPVRVPLSDAALALQYIRTKATDWNIDPDRIGLTGGSAGACTALWLAFHDDLADPHAENPVLRESTRVKCAAAEGAQTTLDPVQILEWMPNSTYGGQP